MSTACFNNNHSIQHLSASIKIEDLPLMIQSCHEKSVVLLYDNFPEVEPILKRLVDSFEERVILYDTSTLNRSEIKRNLFSLYTDKKQSFFVLIVHDPQKILYTADELFDQHSRGAAAIMPHRSRWLVWIWNATQEKVFLQQQTSSKMDNVAVFCLPADCVNVSSGLIEIRGIYTFFWNKNRSKRAQIIREDEILARGKDCIIYPNRKFGLNGRHLDVLTRIYMIRNYFDYRRDPHTGKETFSGFRIHLLKVLSRSLNFTYKISVLAQSNRSTLDELKRRDWDIGLLMWSTTTPYNNIDVTYPVHYEGIRGMYLRPSTQLTIDTLPTFLLAPLPVKSLLFIPASLLLAAIMWIIVASVQPQENDHALENSNESDKDCGETESSPGTIKTVCRVKMKYFLSVVWALTAAVVNQVATAPMSSRMSSRIILWSWCATMVIWYALYTGSLTSKIVKKPETLPFNTFNDMMANGRFKWGTLRDDQKIKEVFDNSTNSMFKRLGANLITLEDRKDIDSARDELFEKLQEPFVFIYYESFIANIARLGNYVVVKENLMTMNRGLSIPKGSELRIKLSDAILTTHDSGIINHLLTNYSLTLQSNTSRVSPKHKKDHRGFGVNDILALIFLTGLLVIFSSIVLIIEIILASWPAIMFQRIITTLLAHRT